MDTNLYRYAIAASESKSLSAAARKLYISQPALTKQIGRLEKQLGIQLFARSRSSFQITPAGEQFVAAAREIVAIEDRLLQELGQSSNMATVVQVATNHRGGTHAARSSAKFFELYPDITLDFRNFSSNGCEGSLISRQSEIAVYTRPVCSDKLVWETVAIDELLLVVPTRYPIFTEGEKQSAIQGETLELEPERLLKAPITWLKAPPEQGLSRVERKLWETLNFVPEDGQFVEYVDTRYYMAISGKGIALMPRDTVKEKDLKQGRAAFCHLKGLDISRDIIIAKKKGEKLSPGAQAYWNFLLSERECQPDFGSKDSENTP